MPLTAELLYQALVLSSVFLMAISLPKVLLYTGWSSWRLYVYEHLLNSDILRKANVLGEVATMELLEPGPQFSQIVKEMESYIHDIKKPIVELLSASVILLVGAAGLHVDHDAVGLLVMLEALMVIVLILTFVQLARMFLKMRKMMGGGPLVPSLGKSET